MTRKQNLTQELVTRLEECAINLPVDMQFRAPSDFWAEYPHGYCLDPKNRSLEGMLSCLSEKTLEEILGDEAFEDGADLADLWGEWGERCYFTDAPCIVGLGNGRIALRIRWDSYLMCNEFKTGFENCRDAFSGKVAGSSSYDLATAIRAITYPGENDARKASWELEYNWFRRAMFVSYAMDACKGQDSFFNLMTSNSDVLDEFLQLTACWQFSEGIMGPWSFREVTKACEMVEPQGDLVASIPLIYKRKGQKDSKSKMFAIAQFGNSYVQLQLIQPVGMDNICYTVNFPKWDLPTWLTEYRECGNDPRKMMYLTERDYLYLCWKQLIRFLLVTSGAVYATNCFWKLPVRGTEVRGDGSGVTSVEKLDRALYKTAKSYSGLDELLFLAGHPTDAIKMRVEKNEDAVLVSENCFYCGREVKMFWDIEKWGQKAYCPLCGNVLWIDGERREDSKE